MIGIFLAESEPVTSLGPIPYIFGITVAALMTVIYYLYGLLKDANRLMENLEERHRKERKDEQDRFERERPKKWAEANALALMRRLEERDEKRRAGE